jgi:SAM-dependent methyltransferase
MKFKSIDNNRPFDWGKTSKDYAKYRDIYPESFYQSLRENGVGLPGQTILDIGTGTGVLARNLAKAGSICTGVDASEEQITQAKALSEEASLTIDWQAQAAENLEYSSASFSAVTALQCWWYFDHQVLVPNIAKWLKPKGKLMVGIMAWLVEPGSIAAKTEELVLEFNPEWSGGGFKGHQQNSQEWAKPFFKKPQFVSYEENIPFTKESWRGRMRACRGVAASLPENKVLEFDQALQGLLDEISVEDQLLIKHQIYYYLFTKQD